MKLKYSLLLKIGSKATCEERLKKLTDELTPSGVTMNFWTPRKVPPIKTLIFNNYHFQVNRYCGPYATAYTSSFVKSIQDVSFGEIVVISQMCVLLVIKNVMWLSHFDIHNIREKSNKTITYLSLILYKM